jgi:hypothetical protein
MTTLNGLSRRKFMATVAAASGTALLSKELFASPPQDPVVNPVQKNGKTISQEKVPWQVLPFPMQQVRLGEGPCKLAMEADRQYLRSLPPDRLLHTFRINAGIAVFGSAAGGMGGPGLRTSRALRGRPLSFRLRADVCLNRRRRAEGQWQYGGGRTGKVPGSAEERISQRLSD